MTVLLPDRLFLAQGPDLPSTMLLLFILFLRCYKEGYKKSDNHNENHIHNIYYKHVNVWRGEGYHFGLSPKENHLFDPSVHSARKVWFVQSEVIVVCLKIKTL